MGSWPRDRTVAAGQVASAAAVDNTFNWDLTSTTSPQYWQLVQVCIFNREVSNKLYFFPDFNRHTNFWQSDGMCSWSWSTWLITPASDQNSPFWILTHLWGRSALDYRCGHLWSRFLPVMAHKQLFRSKAISLTLSLSWKQNWKHLQMKSINLFPTRLHSYGFCMGYFMPNMDIVDKWSRCLEQNCKSACTVCMYTANAKSVVAYTCLKPPW